MVWIWLRFLQKYGDLQPADRVYILADSASKNYLDQFVPYFPLKLCFEIREIPIPSTLREGFLERFQYWNYLQPEKDEVICYTDIDLVVLAPIRWMETLCKEGTLYVYPEGNLLEGNYLGEILEERDHRLFASDPELARTQPGFTCTLFFFRGDSMKSAFQRIRIMTLQHDDTLYAPEQPFFNRIVFDALRFPEENPEVFKVGILEKEWIQYNCLVRNCSKEAKFLNFCGEPGDQEFHWKKMFMAFLADT